MYAICMTQCLSCSKTLPVKPPGQPGPGKRYCDLGCRARASNDRAARNGKLAEWTATSRERKLAVQPVYSYRCAYCDELYSSRRSNSAHCGSAPCRRRYNAHRQAFYNSQRRSRNSPTPFFPRLEIFERDGWMCGICGDPVDPELAHPEPLSASLDHVVPLAQGGRHVRSNCQCTHLVCNLRKNRF